MICRDSEKYLRNVFASVRRYIKVRIPKDSEKVIVIRPHIVPRDDKTRQIIVDARLDHFDILTLRHKHVASTLYIDVNPCLFV